MISVHLSPPHLGTDERSLLNQALESNWVAPLGPQVDAFEAEVAELVGAGRAVALSSGTAALHLSLVLLGVGRGDEVWTSSFTFAATANPVTYVGARPVFLDVDPDTWTLDPGLLEEGLRRASRLGRLPKAVIAVDLYGQCADYGPIRVACRAHGVPLVEDAAEALGSTYLGRAAGTLGDLGVYSFNGNKIITTGGGGMLVCERAAWADRARFLASQARESGAALPALADRLQLPDEQPPRRRRAGPAPGPGAAGPGQAPGERLLPGGAPRRARTLLPARGQVRALQLLAHLPPGGPRAVRRHPRRHPRRAGVRRDRIPAGLEAAATCSRRSPAAPSWATAPRRRCSNGACASPAARPCHRWS